MKLLLFLPIYYIISSLAIPFVTTLFLPKDEVAEIPASSEVTISVLNTESNVETSMNIEDYLIGVVAAEMPAAFETEALKAQAVAARTYTHYKSGTTDHTSDVCTNFAHCQAYYTESNMRDCWGNDYDFYYNKIKDAVYSTKGEILTYNDEPIMAVFHSMGGGMTENSADVWGQPLPYLVSVPSPGEEDATNYNSTVEITFDEFKNTITAKYPNAKIQSFLDVSQPTLNESGHVKTILIGGVSITGVDLRSMFNLRSTKFDITFSENKVTFFVTGYGHGVGMSQYGANAMAKSGNTYNEILSHYYQGAILSE